MRLRDIGQLFSTIVKREKVSTDPDIPWWEYNAETLQYFARLPDWGQLLALDCTPAWSEKKRERILQENGIVAQIVKFGEFVLYIVFLW